MLLVLDFASETPIYQQIRDSFVLAIADGMLKNGERLPTVRALAQEAGVNVMTVNKAYQLLKQEGYIVTDRRNGATVQCEGRLNEASWQEMQRTIRLLVAEARLGGVTRQELSQEVERQYLRLSHSAAAGEGPDGGAGIGGMGIVGGEGTAEEDGCPERDLLWAEG